MAYVGVPEAERTVAQKLEINLEMGLDLSRAASSQRLTMTVDYAEVHRRVIELVHERPRALIESVAEDLAQMILQNFVIQRVDVEVRKFILPNVRSVSVRIVREKR